MNDSPITFIPTTIPAGLCFASEQERYNYFASHLSGFLPGVFTAVNIGSSEPSANDREKPWIRLNADGSFDKWYTYFAGKWCAPHRYDPNCGVVVMWEGVLAAVDTFDGGSVAAITDTTGPMWSVVSEMAGKFPLGPGTLASSTVIAAGDTGGEEKHVLTVDELANHTHLNKKFSGVAAPGGSETTLPYSTTSSSTITDSPTGATGGVSGVTAGHNNMPPYRGIYFLRRTTRRFYTV